MSIQFTTMDMEFADVYIPSICSIAIIDWEDGVAVNQYYRLINPECEIAPELQARHGITSQATERAPKLYEIWKEIYDLLDGKTVFLWKGNATVSSLFRMTELSALRLPNITFGSVQSIVKRTWPEQASKDLEETCSRLGICKHPHNASDDAWALGHLLFKALQVHKVSGVGMLFRLCGFAGGVVLDGVHIPYRSRKGKGGYYSACMQKQRTGSSLDWQTAESLYPGTGAHATLPVAGSTRIFI